MGSTFRKIALSLFAVGLLSALPLAASAPAEARMGGFHGGGFHGGGFRGFHGGGFRSFGGFHRGGFGGFNRGFAVHRGFGGFRPVAFGHRFHHRRHFGGAFAAGLIGAAAVGLASSAYAYPYDYGYGYYPAAYGYGDECVVVRRARVTPWGAVVIRRRVVCY